MLKNMHVANAPKTKFATVARALQILARPQLDVLLIVATCVFCRFPGTILAHTPPYHLCCVPRHSLHTTTEDAKRTHGDPHSARRVEQINNSNARQVRALRAFGPFSKRIPDWVAAKQRRRSLADSEVTLEQTHKSTQTGTKVEPFAKATGSVHNTFAPAFFLPSSTGLK